ncbi:MAG: pentapeptide repeat protein [Gammaproteobacteria bacterium]|jgi:uncharacterized protein YjbI with pentapeptide repeats|nr:pentapeptide repeat protein [Gammaproteobacteria bacterium]
MKIKQILGCFISVFSLSTHAIAAPNTSSTVVSNVQTVLQTCQCPNCDLSKADLSGFQPGNGAAVSQYAFGKNYSSQAMVTCKFNQANFSNANLSNTNFVTANVPVDSIIGKAVFIKANFSSANLSNSQFGYADFTGANFSNAILNGASLYVCNLSSANLSNASLLSVVSQRSNMGGFGSNFSSANFSNADLTNANLDGNFTQANFSHAKFKNTILSTSNDDYAVTAGKAASSPADYFKGTNFSNTDLRQVSFEFPDMAGNPEVDLSEAILCHTIMPDGSISNQNC